jgi:UDP-2,4-diacetamido-2,4,6-trideoxy-beta-L-altropyranose hydrolase
MRCLALAEAWRIQRGEVIFVMGQVTPFVDKRIRSEEFEILRSQFRAGSSEDADAIKHLIAERKASWIVVDGYHFGADYLSTVAESRCKLLRIDDLGQSTVGADVILNQNLHATPEMYPNRQAHARLLLGPHFALLRDEFTGQRNRIREIAPVASKILITAGGGDQTHILELTMAALETLPSLEVRIVVPDGASPRIPSGLRNRVRFEREVHNMCELMSWADLALSAAGSTCWELCCVGLPSLLLDIADNQRPLAQELHCRGIAVHVEHANTEAIADAVRQLVLSRQRRYEMSCRGKELVDGKGRDRVLSALRASCITLRSASNNDAQLLWGWANDPQVRSASFSSRLITWEEHCGWLTAKLNRRKDRVYIAQEDEVPLGAVRLEMKSDFHAEIAITLAPESRGQGMARYLIEAAVAAACECWDLREVHALIRPENAPSRKAFDSAGFRFRDVAGVNGCEALRYVWGAPSRGSSAECLGTAECRL